MAAALAEGLTGGTGSWHVVGGARCAVQSCSAKYRRCASLHGHSVARVQLHVYTVGIIPYAMRFLVNSFLLCECFFGKLISSSAAPSEDAGRTHAAAASRWAPLVAFADDWADATIADVIREAISAKAQLTEGVALPAVASAAALDAHYIRHAYEAGGTGMVAALLLDSPLIRAVADKLVHSLTKQQPAMFAVDRSAEALVLLQRRQIELRRSAGTKAYAGGHASDVGRPASDGGLGVSAASEAAGVRGTHEGGCGPAPASADAGAPTQDAMDGPPTMARELRAIDALESAMVDAAALGVQARLLEPYRATLKRAIEAASPAVRLQASGRGLAARRRWLLVRKAVRTLQARAVATAQGRRRREEYLAERASAVVIQSRIHGRQQSLAFGRQRSAARTVQERARAHASGRQQRHTLGSQRDAATVMQARARARAARVEAERRRDALPPPPPSMPPPPPPKATNCACAVCPWVSLPLLTLCAAPPLSHICMCTCACD